MHMGRLLNPALQPLALILSRFDCQVDGTPFERVQRCSEPFPVSDQEMMSGPGGGYVR
jgi:hypothetical protein